MAMLHTVNKSPYERNTLSTALGYVSSGDSVLLIEDGVYAAMASGSAAASVKEAMASCQVYALREDLAARGVSEDKVVDGVKLVDYSGFVELAVSNDKVQSWL